MEAERPREKPPPEGHECLKRTNEWRGQEEVDRLQSCSNRSETPQVNQKCRRISSVLKTIQLDKQINLSVSVGILCYECVYLLIHQFMHKPLLIDLLSLAILVFCFLAGVYVYT